VFDDGNWLNLKRLEAYSKITFVLFAMMAGSFFARWVTEDHTVHLPIVDFSVYWASSYFALQGEASRVFDLTSFCGDFHGLLPVSPCGYPWLYPPSYFLLILPLSLIPFWPAYFSFIGMSIAAYVITIRKIIRGRVAMWCLAAFPGLWMNVLAGQNGGLTAALAGAALLNLEKRPALAGMLIGSLVIKPQLGVLFPVALIAIKAWRVFFIAAGTAMAWMALGVLVLGTNVWDGWLSRLDLAQQIMSWTTAVYMLPSLFGFLRTLGFPVATAYVGHGIVAMIVLYAVWDIWRRDVVQPVKYAALITGTLLVSPRLLEYDLAWLGLSISWLVGWNLKTGWLKWEKEVLLAAWATPLFCIAISKVFHIQVGALILLLVFLVILQKSRMPEAGRALE